MVGIMRGKRASWFIFLAGSVLFAAAVLVAPATKTQTSEGSALLPPPSGDILKVVSLGRPDAIGDLLWLRTVQFIGAPFAESINYAGLDAWILAISDLSPSFELPYFAGGILLSTVPGKSAVADEVLARGEAQSPGDYQFPMWRGFVANFGALDADAAAAHYERAQRLPGSPAYLKGLVERLKKDKRDCAGIRVQLAEVLRGSDEGAASTLLKSRSRKLILHCERSRIEQAAHAYRLNKGKPATDVADLLAEGLLKTPPFSFPGECWKLEFENSTVIPCP
jgi:hypothetical protein